MAATQTIAEEFAADLNNLGVRPAGSTRSLQALGELWNYEPVAIALGTVEFGEQRVRWTGKERGWVTYITCNARGLSHDLKIRLAEAQRERALRELAEADKVLGNGSHRNGVKK